MKKYPPPFSDFSQIAHGGDYNPDQWIDCYPEVVEEDLRLMDLAGCNTFSLGIFAWARYEPREGEYYFDWMRDILDRLHAAGKQVVLATPSGSKPAWLSRAYPEIRRVDTDGRRDHHHGRHNHCFTSPVYRKKIAELNRRLAEQFGSHPAVKMWHISNEYSGECHCDLCHKAFRDWLKNRYGSLEKLNHAWWAHFWSHTFHEWEEIDPRDVSIDGMALDWKRFVTYQTVEFMKAEIAALRQGGTDLPMTTNMMGFFPHIDYWRFLEVVDVVADDCYPGWNDDESDWRIAAGLGLVHDMHRSMKGGKPWLLLESCPDTPQWFGIPKLKRPGVYRTEMLQALAHGADAIMYFQWRKGRGAYEKFHGAVVDHEGSERPRIFRQVSELGNTLTRLDSVVGSTTRPEVALIMDWEVRWAMDTSKGVANPLGGDVYMRPLREAHRSFWRRGIPTDVVESSCDLNSYKLVVAPQLYLLKPGVAERLRDFVEQGGTLMLTWRSGIVNESNLCFQGGFPGGGLRELCGVWAEEIDYLRAGESQEVVMSEGNSLGLCQPCKTGPICEILHAEGAEVLATVTTDFYAGHPVLTRNRVGKGSVFYQGAPLGEAFQEELTDALQRECDLDPIIRTALPLGVGVQQRTDGEQEFVFIQNFTKDSKEVQLDQRDYICMERDAEVASCLTLDPWQTRILSRDC